MPDQLAFEDAKGGMNAADPPHKIARNQLARMVNCAIKDGLPTTRCGTRVVPLTGEDAEFIAVNNIQGSLFFNPAKGQSGLLLADDVAGFALAVGGRKYMAHLKGRGASTESEVVNISNGLLTNRDFHLVWFSAWEDNLIAQDGNSNAFLWNPKEPARYSLGYNTIEKPKSEVPNGGTVMAYVHGRGIVIVNSRFVLVGDILHRVSQSTSANLLQFTEQVYWATGQYFLPPSAMGGINAAAILALKNTAHGHGDLMLHCEDGVFSLDLSQYPRSGWAEKSLVRHALLQSGASGPYAVALRDGDQFFRSRKGIQSLRSAAAEAQFEGNPNQPLSVAVDTWLKADYPRWLRFCSTLIWDRESRLFVTTQPIVQGRFRWHRGAVVRPFDAAPTEPGGQPAWEGLWTLPTKTAGIIQFVSGTFDKEERVFAWTRGTDGRNRLVEFVEGLRDDIQEDGSAVRIRSQAITRAIDAGKWWAMREYTNGRLYLRNIVGKVDWGIWFRTSESPAWIAWQAGTVENPDFTGRALESAAPRSLPIPLGALPKKCTEASPKPSNESRAIQFLVRWQGYCQFEGVKLTHGEKDIQQDDIDKKQFNLVFTPANDSTYDDFEYSVSEEPLWNQ